MEVFETSKYYRHTPEEYLRAFLDSKVKVLWPQGWMQTRQVTCSMFFSRLHVAKAIKKCMPPVKCSKKIG